ncbi:MAG: hypothetical protein WB297_15465 [Actinomycetota bacterium]
MGIDGHQRFEIVARLFQLRQEAERDPESLLEALRSFELGIPRECPNPAFLLEAPLRLLTARVRRLQLGAKLQLPVPLRLGDRQERRPTMAERQAHGVDVPDTLLRVMKDQLWSIALNAREASGELLQVIRIEMFGVRIDRRNAKPLGEVEELSDGLALGPMSERTASRAKGAGNRANPRRSISSCADDHSGSSSPSSWIASPDPLSPSASLTISFSALTFGNP